MLGKNELIRKFIAWCEEIGIDPMLPLLLVTLLYGIYRIKDIKNWNHLSWSDKGWDILLGLGFLLIVMYYLFRLM